MTHNIYNTPVPHSTDSDKSDDEEMSPIGSFGPNRRMRNGKWWKDHMEAYVVLLILIVTGFMSPVISRTILRKQIIAVQDRRCC